MVGVRCTLNALDAELSIIRSSADEGAGAPEYHQLSRAKPFTKMAYGSHCFRPVSHLLSLYGVYRFEHFRAIGRSHQWLTAASNSAESFRRLEEAKDRRIGAPVAVTYIQRFHTRNL